MSVYPMFFFFPRMFSFYQVAAPTSDRSQCSNQPGALQSTAMQSSTHPIGLLPELPPQPTVAAATPAPPPGAKHGFHAMHY